jgi:hypothetical protein
MVLLGNGQKELKLKPKINFGELICFARVVNHNKRKITLFDRRNGFARLANRTNMTEWSVLRNQTNQSAVSAVRCDNRDKGVRRRGGIETVSTQLRPIEANFCGLELARLADQTFKQSFCNSIPVIVLIGIRPRDARTIQTGYQSPAGTPEIENEISYRCAVVHPLLLSNRSTAYNRRYGAIASA